MNKEKVLYIYDDKKYFESNLINWNEIFKSTLSEEENINRDKNKIETPYVIIYFVRRKPLFTKKYDIVLNADKQDDDAKLFALGIGRNY